MVISARATMRPKARASDERLRPKSGLRKPYSTPPKAMNPVRARAWWSGRTPSELFGPSPNQDRTSS